VTAHRADAFSVDDHSMNQPNGSPRFSDPDEQMPLGIVSIQQQPSSPNFQDNQLAASDTLPSSSFGPYDPYNHSYYPQRR